MNKAFVMFPRDPNVMLYDLLMSACQAHHFQPRVVQEVNNEQMILSLVALGMGLGFVLDSVANIRPHGVMLRPVVDLDVSMELDLVWLETNRNPLLPRLIDLVHDLFEAPGGVALPPAEPCGACETKAAARNANRNPATVFVGPASSLTHSAI